MFGIIELVSIDSTCTGLFVLTLIEQFWAQGNFELFVLSRPSDNCALYICAKENRGRANSSNQALMASYMSFHSRKAL